MRSVSLTKPRFRSPLGLRTTTRLAELILRLVRPLDCEDHIRNLEADIAIMAYQVDYNPDGSYLALVTGADAQPYNWYNAYFSASGQISGYWLANADGSYTFDDIDYDNSKTYSLLKVEINSSGQATSEFTNNHDGTHTSVVFDTTNTQSYAAYYATSNASGQTESIYFQNDDGTAGSVAYDYDNSQMWTTFTADYAAGGALRDVAYKDDDGSGVYVQYDYDNTQSWSAYQSVYDVNGAVVREYFANRDGTALSVTHDIYDARFNYVFENIATLTNTLGVVLDKAWNEANGAQYNEENVMIGDQIDPAAAPRVTIYAPGHILAKESFGTRFYSATYYDWSNTEYWSQVVENNGGETILDDNGSTSHFYRGQPGYITFSLYYGFPF